MGRGQRLPTTAPAVTLPELWEINWNGEAGVEEDHTVYRGVNGSDCSCTTSSCSCKRIRWEQVTYANPAIMAQYFQDFYRRSQHPQLERYLVQRVFVASRLQPQDLQVDVERNAGDDGDEIGEITFRSSERTVQLQERLQQIAAMHGAQQTSLTDQLQQKSPQHPDNVLHEKMHWLMHRERQYQSSLPAWLETASFALTSVAVDDLPQPHRNNVEPYDMYYEYYRHSLQQAKLHQTALSDVLAPVAILSDGQLLDGHLRIKALRAAMKADNHRHTRVPVIVADHTPYVRHDTRPTVKSLQQVLRPR